MCAITVSMAEASTHDRGEVEIFTDGACSGNPGPGGWGAILRYHGVEKELSGPSRPPPITAWS